MKIVTPDGRTLIIQKRDCVNFDAVTYCSSFNYYYVSATVRRDFINGFFTVILAEFPQYDEAAAVKDQLDIAFKRGDKEFIMQGFTTLAADDDLMESIAKLDKIYPDGWAHDFRYPNGKCA